MSRRTNFIEGNDNFREQNLRFVRNEMEDNFNQFFGGGGPQGTAPGADSSGSGLAAPPRDSIVVQPTPDLQQVSSSVELKERRQYIRHLAGISHKQAHLTAVASMMVPSFNLREIQRKRFRMNVEFGDGRQNEVDAQIFDEINSIIASHEQRINNQAHTPPPPSNINWHGSRDSTRQTNSPENYGLIRLTDDNFHAIQQPQAMRLSKKIDNIPQTNTARNNQIRQVERNENMRQVYRDDNFRGAAPNDNYRQNIKRNDNYRGENFQIVERNDRFRQVARNGNFWENDCNFMQNNNYHEEQFNDRVENFRNAQQNAGYHCDNYSSGFAYNRHNPYIENFNCNQRNFDCDQFRNELNFCFGPNNRFSNNFQGNRDGNFERNFQNPNMNNYNRDFQHNNYGENRHDDFLYANSNNCESRFPDNYREQQSNFYNNRIGCNFGGNFPNNFNRNHRNDFQNRFDFNSGQPNWNNNRNFGYFDNNRIENRSSRNQVGNRSNSGSVSRPTQRNQGAATVAALKRNSQQQPNQCDQVPTKKRSTAAKNDAKDSSKPFIKTETVQQKNLKLSATKTSNKKEILTTTANKAVASVSSEEPKKKGKIPKFKQAFIVGGHRLPYINKFVKKLPQPENESYAVAFFEKQPIYNTSILATNNDGADLLFDTDDDSSIDDDQMQTVKVCKKERSEIRKRINKNWSKIYDLNNYNCWYTWWTGFKWCEPEMNKKLEKFGSLNIKNMFIPSFPNMSTEKVIRIVMKSAHSALQENTQSHFENSKTIYTLMNDIFLENLKNPTIEELQDTIRGTPNHLWVYKMRSMVYIWSEYYKIASSSNENQRDFAAILAKWKSPLFHWLCKQSFDELKAISAIEWTQHNELVSSLESHPA